MSVEVLSDGQDDIVKVITTAWQAELVPSIGGILTRLKDRRSGLDLLRYPTSRAVLWNKPEIWGMPLLFPPNYIYRGKFNWNGREYNFPLNSIDRLNNIHGFFLHQRWKLTEQQETPNETWVELSTEHQANSEVFKYFPHPFQAKLTYRFTAEQVIQELEFHNRDSVPMPLGFGFHTNFRQPFGEPSAGTDKPFTIRLSTGSYYWGERNKNLRTMAKPWRAEDYFHTPEGHPLAEKKEWRHFPVNTMEVNGKPFTGAILDSPSDKLRLYYEIDRKAYTQWCIWNGSGNENFISIEPMSWMIDAPNLPLPPTISGLRGLGPDQRLKASCSIRVEPLE